MTGAARYGFNAGDMIEAINKHFPHIEQDLNFVMDRTKNVMKAFIITLTNEHDPTVSTRKLLKSIAQFCPAVLEPFIYDAVTPKTLKANMTKNFDNTIATNITYTYPKTVEENRYDIRTGLKLSAYQSKSGNPDSRIACFMSHYNLWRTCVEINEPIMILESDAIFVGNFDWVRIQKAFTGMVLGLNNPIGATRRASVFNTAVEKGHKRGALHTIMEAPDVDEFDIPQGLAGNSAYIIKPSGAAKLIGLTAQHGIWPNDALMCKQLMGKGNLQVLFPYITKVQPQQESTTSR